MAEAEVLVSLTRDEALVLFEWLHRTADDDALAEITGDPAEVIALDALSASLERELVEPFMPDYADLLVAAQARLRGEATSPS